MFDCGPVGHGSGGHGHADTLSFQYHFRGKPFLIDPGTYTYNLDYDLRNHFRSTAAHNTVAVDGLDQSVMGHRMSWTRFAAARLTANYRERSFSLIGGLHDGYERLADPVTVRRYLFSDRDGEWIVFDHFTASAAHRYDLYYHLDDSCVATPLERGIAIKNGDITLFFNLHLQGEAGGMLEGVTVVDGAIGSEGATIMDEAVAADEEGATEGEGARGTVAVSDGTLAVGGGGARRGGRSPENVVEILKGAKSPVMAGWISRRYGEMRETTTLRFGRVFEGMAAMVSTFSDHGDLSVTSLTDDPGEIALRIRRGDGDSSLLYHAISGEGSLALPEASFSGELLHLRDETLFAARFRSVALPWLGSVSCDRPIGHMYVSGDTVEIHGEEAMARGTESAGGGLRLEISGGRRVLFNGREIRERGGGRRRD